MTHPFIYACVAASAEVMQLDVDVVMKRYNNPLAAAARNHALCAAYKKLRLTGPQISAQLNYRSHSTLSIAMRNIKVLQIDPHQHMVERRIDLYSQQLINIAQSTMNVNNAIMPHHRQGMLEKELKECYDEINSLQGKIEYQLDHPDWYQWVREQHQKKVRAYTINFMLNNLANGQPMLGEKMEMRSDQEHNNTLNTKK